jgi:hypothetical protein
LHTSQASVTWTRFSFFATVALLYSRDRPLWPVPWFFCDPKW